MVFKRILWSVLALATIVVGTQNSAQAAFTFGSFTYNSGTFALTTDGGAFSASALVNFNFVAGGITGTPTPGFTQYAAKLTVTGSLVTGTGLLIVPGGDLLAQDVTTMTIDVRGVGGLYDSMQFVGASVAGGSLDGKLGSGTAVLSASNVAVPAATVVYTSDFLTFASGTKVLTLNLAQVKNTTPSATGMLFSPTGPVGPITVGDIKTFTASINGLFDAEPKANIIHPDDIVPEPASVALWGGIGGLGLLLVARRRKNG